MSYKYRGEDRGFALFEMENKTLIGIFAVILAVSVLFLGAYMTGLVVQKVDYGDLCKIDDDCSKGQCCLISQDNKSLGICMEACQSFEFLCKSNEQCEEGTVCCISEGMEYGLCNDEAKCMSIDLFSEYVGKSAIAEKSTEQPAPMMDSRTIILIETAIIIALISFIIWMLIRKKHFKK